MICEFFTPALADGISLDSAQVSKTLLSILDNLYNTLVCMVSILPPISNSFRLFLLL